MHTPSNPNAMNVAAAHQRWLELLPFLANGSLAGDERVALEAHLAQCAACRAELAAEQGLLQAFKQSAPPLADGDERFAAILAAARAESMPPKVARLDARPRFGRPLSRPLARRLALAATLAAVTVGIVQFQGGAPTAVQTFHTLSRDHGQVVGADVLYVAFEPGLASERIAAALRAVEAEVLAGPNADQVLTVRVPAARLAGAVAALEAQPGVRLVAPAAPGAESSR